MDKTSLEVLLGRGLSVEEIAERFGTSPSTVSYWIEKCGLTANRRHKHAPRGLVPRLRLLALVEGGMTVRQIAAAIDRSESTVRRTLARYGLKNSAVEPR